MPNKHNWGYVEKEGRFFVGCQDCGGVGKVFTEEIEAKMEVLRRKRIQSGSNSVYNKYPKTGLSRKMRGARSVERKFLAK